MRIMPLRYSPCAHFPPLSSRSEQVYLASLNLLYMHLALADMRFDYYNYLPV